MKLLESTADRLSIRLGPEFQSFLVGLAILGVLILGIAAQISPKLGLVLGLATACGGFFWILIFSRVVWIVLDRTNATGSVRIGSLASSTNWDCALGTLQGADFVPDALWLVDPERTLIRDFLSIQSQPMWETEAAMRPALILTDGRKIPLAPPGLMPGQWSLPLALINAWFEETRPVPPALPTGA